MIFVGVSKPRASCNDLPCREVMTTLMPGAKTMISSRHRCRMGVNVKDRHAHMVVNDYRSDGSECICAVWSSTLFRVEKYACAALPCHINTPHCLKPEKARPLKIRKSWRAALESFSSRTSALLVCHRMNSTLRMHSRHHRALLRTPKAP